MSEKQRRIKLCNFGGTTIVWSSTGRFQMKSRVLAILLLIMISSALTIITDVSVDAQSGRVIDVFTQKAPFDGKGANQSSDMFQPQELVILYARVTYNDFPVANKLVAFSVNGPLNPFENQTAGGSSITNGSGLAEFSFRIPWPSQDPEMKVFGEWQVSANVDVADQRVVDTLSFRVGWIIKITNIVTLNSLGNPQDRFLRQATVVFNLTLENSAMTAKPGTITIDVQDSASHPIIHIQLGNLVVPSGTSYCNASALIPADASLGTASVSAAIFTAPIESGGVLYSPGVSTEFEIITRGIVIRDVEPSKTTVQKGEIVEIMVTVENIGNETESFEVYLYYDNTLIGKKHVDSLAPSTEMQLIFEWNTTNVDPGTYRISAVAVTVEGTIEIAEDTFVDDTVTVLPCAFWMSWIIWIVFGTIVFVGVLILLWLLGTSGRRRRRRKKKPVAFYTIVSRPHV